MGISTPTAIALASAAVSAAGTGVSYVASQNNASAARSAQQQQMIAQNQAFEARNAAQIQQTQEQAAAQDQGQARYQQEEQAMRDSQSQALAQEQDTINRMNQQEQQVQNDTTQQVQNTTQNVITPQTLAAAQAASEAQREAGTAPVVQDIGASNPTASPNASTATKSAMAEAMAKAAAYTQQYGKNLAVLGSYSAPVATTGIATKELAGSLMPSAEADQLLKSGASARLLPSQVAYRNATDLGQSELASNTQRTTDLMNLSKMREQNAADLATLGQADTNANIQTGLNYAQARAAALNSLGQGASALGNAGIMYGAANGGFSDLFGSGGTAPITNTNTAINSIKPTQFTGTPFSS
jgi:hypothetical protein